MTSAEKLDHPPAAENWSRLQYPDVDMTARKCYSFLRGGPRWSYMPGRNAAKWHIEDGIDLSAALRVARTGSRLGLQYNVELIEAFFDYVASRPIHGLRSYDDLVEFFPIGPRAAIPVRPLTVIKQNGKPFPIFLFPWNNVSLDPYQRSVFFTVLDRSVFRLTDFQGSDGQVLLFPKQEVNKGVWQRRPVIWTRNEFTLLSDQDLHDQVRIFIEGKERAKHWFEFGRP